MPSSRKIVHQTVYFDSLFNFSCPSVPIAVAGSLAPPESGWARVHGSVWGHGLGLAGSSKREPGVNPSPMAGFVDIPAVPSHSKTLLLTLHACGWAGLGRKLNQPLAKPHLAKLNALSLGQLRWE